MALTFAAIYLLGNKSRVGFVVMMVDNLSWAVIGLWAHSYAMVLANLGFFSMNVRGLSEVGSSGPGKPMTRGSTVVTRPSLTLLLTSDLTARV